MAVKIWSTGRGVRKGPRSWDSRFQTKRGIALLVTVIFMAVMLSFGLALASLSYKQSVLASTATQTQAAFFAADGALECALYADQRQGAFIYGDYGVGNLPSLDTVPTNCDGVWYSGPLPTWDSTRLTVTERIAFNKDATGTYKNCADVTIYKYAVPIGGFRAYLFATGYNVSCSALTSGTRIVSRGIYLKY